MSAHFLIAGCGYLGSEVAEQLLANGHQVTGLTHSEESAEKLRSEAAFPVETCDLADVQSMKTLAGRVDPPQGILHCASSGRGGFERYEAVYLRGCENLLHAFPDSALLFTSSTSVYPQVEGEWITEDSLAEPDRETGKMLRRAEEVTLKHGGIVARLAGIYGPGRSVILQRFLDGSAVIEEGESRYLNQIHRDDAASALACLLEGRDQAAGRVFNVSDGHPMTQRECYERLADRFGKEPPPEAPRDLNRKRGWTHKRISNEAMRNLGWTPAYPFFLEAIENDVRLLPSIQALVDASQTSND